MIKIDKRTRFFKAFSGYKTNDYIGAVSFGLLAGLLAGIILYNSLNKAEKTLPEPRKEINMIKVVEVAKASDNSEEYYKETPLKYIRWKGQQLGYKDGEISKFIQVARCESGFNLNPNASNKTSTAKGVYQILIGTWESNDCGGKRNNFVDNIDCAYKIYAKRGLQPWNASKSCWNK